MEQATNRIHARPETTVAVAWPTIGACAAGRLVGRWSAIETGFGVLTVGNLLALATIPISLTVFCWQLMPYVCRRYLLTDRRVVVLEGLSATEGPAVALDGFDAIDIETLPGQEWLRSGDLVFKLEGREVFRLAGVSRPETFRQLCLKTRLTLLAVRRVLDAQAV